MFIQTAPESEYDRRFRVAYAELEALVRADFDEVDEQRITKMVVEQLREEDADAEADREFDDATYGYDDPEDTPSIANCDEGSGEGRYHGRF